MALAALIARGAKLWPRSVVSGFVLLHAAATAGYERHDDDVDFESFCSQFLPLFSLKRGAGLEN